MITANNYLIHYDKEYYEAALYLEKRLNNALKYSHSIFRVDFQLRKNIQIDNTSFSLKAQNHKEILIEAANITSIMRGITFYLSSYLNWGCFWQGERIDSVDVLPVPIGEFYQSDLPENILYYNPCTFGYSTVWWDETRHDKEFDWMLAHGINMPLALMGQEYIFKKVWKKFSIDNLDDYFTGPAFLPWHRMGNVNGIGGPLPDDWIEHERKLQQYFLNKARKLGMKPILQGFSGFVPPAFRELYKDTKFIETAWSGFAPTVKIDPLDPLFVEISKCYTEELIAEYGTDHLYLADAFNEMSPPKDVDPKAYAQSSGEAIYRGMEAADKDAIWAMQSWQFLGHREFWTKEVVEEFFSKVPREKTLVIDLGAENESTQQWKFYDGYNEYPWLWTIFHNGGATPSLFGDLAALSKTWYTAQSSDKNKSMIGAGIACEGLETNPIFYEMASDLFLKRYPGNFSRFLETYCRRRYGAQGIAMQKAFEALLHTVYSKDYGRFLDSGWQYSASYHNIALIKDSKKIINGLEVEETLKLKIKNRFKVESDFQTFEERNFTEKLRESVAYCLECGNALVENPLYQFDLIDITRQMLSDHVDKLFVKFQKEFEAKNIEQMKDIANDVKRILDMQVSVLSCNDAFSLKKWVGAAQSLALNEEQKKLYSFNAKDQITRWGTTKLSDYAKKDMAELVRDVYLPRIQFYFNECLNALKEDRTLDIVEFYHYVTELEDNWVNQETDHFIYNDRCPTVVCSEALTLAKAVAHRHNF
ncbi:MAG: alpha-N-acetylglucosaminidase TIM-barrel domain-containing protein [Oscillospiraceae bacterium]